MLRTMGVRPIAAVLATTILVACGGHGGIGTSVSSFVPYVERPAGPTAEFKVHGTFQGSGPVLFANEHRTLRAGMRPNFTFDHVSVTGTLYPADAAPYAITNTVSIPVPGGTTYSATVPFSNVPVHHNEWVVLQFYGVAADGSQMPIGDLAGLVDPGSSTTDSSTLTTATTQQFQVFATLLANAAIGTSDLDTAPLAPAIAAKISAAKIKPNSSTLLFTGGSLVSLYNAIAPSFQRTLTIKTTPVVKGDITLTRDYTKGSELNLAAQTTAPYLTTLNEPIPKVGTVWGGASCGGIVVNPTPGSPGKVKAVPFSVSACGISNPTGSMTLRNVYGGSLIVGATNNTYSYDAKLVPPFIGGTVKVSGKAPGSVTAVTIPVKTQEITVAVNDPQGFAFGASCCAGVEQMFPLSLNFGAQPLSQTIFYAPSFFAIGRTSIPTGYSAKKNKIVVETYTPFALSSADLQICGGVSCQAVTKSGTFTVLRPFVDAGTKLTYYHWKRGGTVTGITQGTGGYTVKVKGKGYGTLTTTVPAAFLPRQKLQITNSLPLGTLWTVTAKDSLGNLYSNSGVNSGFGYAVVEMDSVPAIVTTKIVTLKFQTSAAGSFNLQQIANSQ